MAADDERAVELFHSDAKGKRSFFKAVLSGTELVTVTGKVGSKGRTTTKSLPDLDAAAKAFDRAVGKKAKAGFYPEWGFEHPFELDADDPPDRTRTLELRDAESPRDRPSRQQLAIVGQNRTLDYREGPHDWGLWTNAGHLQVSRDHDFNDVEPRLPGIFSSPLYSGAPTSRLDGATVAFVYGGSIVEVD
ncbi:MAG: WGR domain-containing protein, partial [Myxococcota bacterium]